MRGYDASRTVLACYSGAGFGADLAAAARADPRVVLVSLDGLYA